MTISVKDPVTGTVGTATPTQIATLQADLGVVTTAGVQQLIDAQTSLGAMAAAVQTLINIAIANNNIIVNQLSNKTGMLPATQVGPIALDGVSVANVQLSTDAINAKFSNQGATAPVVSTVPNFSDTTPDEGQTITITAGTYTGTQPTSRNYRIDIANNGPLSFNTSGPTFVVPTGSGSQAIKIIESASWSGGIVTNTSITRTVNAPPAVPVNTTTASLTGTPNVGLVLTGTVASATNTPTSYIKQFYRNSVAISGANATSAATTLTYTLIAADAGASITFGDFPVNGTGTGIQSVSTSLIVSGGSAPSWDPALGAIRPGWVSGTFQVGVLMTADFGQATNNPASNGYAYQVFRDGVAVAGASGSNVSGFTYTPITADQNHEISFTLTATNAAGSATTTAASVTIAAAVAGGGGAATFVGSTSIGSNTIATQNLPVISGIQNLDYRIIAQTNNGPVTNNVPTGGAAWAQSGSTVTLSINGEGAAIFTSPSNGTEPANYVVTVSSPEIYGAVGVAYRGPTTVIANANASSNVANASPVTVGFPTVTPTAVNQTLVLVGILDNSTGSTTTWTPPSGFTLRAQQDFAATGTQWASIVILDKIVTVANVATGIMNATATLAAGTAGWIAYSMVIG